MSQSDHSAAAAFNDALTGDEELQSRKERVIAGRILMVLAMAVVLIAVLVALFGLPALTMVALAGATLVMVVLIAYAAGF
ncbi:hypothetical protein [Paracoccus alkenifer]|uniref:Aa3 type cytochrome c oxidase subunit IV n=1 Tax=Paracoccus alkenifer TaxID=65735 RepID=A0A1H6JNS9_9RHOB|nr:hypothetical protein [Paracoccus alkenifer]SEH64070.1 hypothetical protein SAMN04488075_0527 [Paracoccus alkenifer]